MSACPVCSWTPGGGSRHEDYVYDLMVIQPVTDPAAALARHVELVAHYSALRVDAAVRGRAAPDAERAG